MEFCRVLLRYPHSLSVLIISTSIAKGSFSAKCEFQAHRRYNQLSQLSTLIIFLEPWVLHHFKVESGTFKTSGNRQKIIKTDLLYSRVCYPHSKTTGSAQPQLPRKSTTAIPLPWSEKTTPVNPSGFRGISKGKS